MTYIQHIFLSQTQAFFYDKGSEYNMKSPNIVELMNDVL